MSDIDVPPINKLRPTTTPAQRVSTPSPQPAPVQRPVMPTAPSPARAAAPAPAEAPAPSEKKLLVVGRDIFLNGQITKCDQLVVEGRVEAELNETKVIEIRESGFFRGDAEIDEAEVRGVVEGSLSVRGRLLIRSTGKVTGKIRYGMLEIECGGQLSGEIQVAGSAAPASGEKSAAARKIAGNAAAPAASAEGGAGQAEIFQGQPR